VLALGVAAAVGASVLYNSSIALQALQARTVPRRHSLRPSLLGTLLRNRRWLAATALGLLGWPLEVTALLLAPVTLVQPCVASGLILLLWLGATKLREEPGRREVIAVAAIVFGIVGIALTAPERSTQHAGAGAIGLALLLVAIPLAAPYLLGRWRPAFGLAAMSAGCAYALTAVASKLLSDALAGGDLPVAGAWLAVAAATEGVGLLSEMSALQHRRATHVAPVMFAVQVLVPVMLAPLIFNESWANTPLGGVPLVAAIAVTLAAATRLGGSRAVGAAMETAMAEER
jgi:uncharacterized membrane protein